ncbi:hypothetical protein FHH43_04015 [Clostridium perfringens]|nr:hypothetical protein [Clostridium perfringens]
MKLKKWENPNLTSLNVEATETCTYDSPHYWHCTGTCGAIESVYKDDAGTFRCLKCNQPAFEVGCGPHPS